MAFDREGLDRVLRAFDQGDWDEIHLIAEGIELHLSVSPGTAVTVAAAETAGTAATAGAAETAALGAAAGIPAGDSAELDVVAPSPGIFWRSPQPGAPAYAEVGDHVEAGATLCIVEVMKLMNHVTAQLAGMVAEVIARNGEQVHRGQVLLRILPDRPGAC
jgi:acetyl-CoA carboxylase biotin carboxyl carrier protein